MADIRVLATDLEFPEGPVVMPDGSVVLVEIRGQRLTRVYPDGRKEVVAPIPGGPNGADGTGLIKAFRHVPRSRHPLGFRLEIAPGHVERHRAPEDMPGRILGGNVGSAAGEGHGEFHLVVEVVRGRGVGQFSSERDDRVGGLGKEKGRLAQRIAPHLAGVLGIVSADAPDPAHREEQLGPLDRDRGR